MQRHLNHLLGLLAAHHGCRDQRPAGNEEMLLRLTEVNACTSFVIRMLVNMRVVYHFHLLFFFFLLSWMGVMLSFNQYFACGVSMEQVSYRRAHHMWRNVKSLSTHRSHRNDLESKTILTVY